MMNVDGKMIVGIINRILLSQAIITWTILHLESNNRGVNPLTWTCILWCANQHFVKHFINNQKITQKFEGENTPYRGGKHTPEGQCR